MTVASARLRASLDVTDSHDVRANARFLDQRQRGPRIGARYRGSAGRGGLERRVDVAVATQRVEQVPKPLAFGGAHVGSAGKRRPAVERVLVVEGRKFVAHRQKTRFTDNHRAAIGPEQGKLGIVTGYQCFAAVQHVAFLEFAQAAVDAARLYCSLEVRDRCYWRCEGSRKRGGCNNRYGDGEEVVSSIQTLGS